MAEQHDAILGCLLGMAVGDALGLPCEGLSRKRLPKLFPNRDHYAFWGHSGWVSDDTEHQILVIQALVASAGESESFKRHLACGLRWWLMRAPAGIGMATLRAIGKLWLGFSPSRSGVFSAGNGPAMRSPILGVVFGEQPDKMQALVKISTEMTHRDPKAFYGALAVALAAHMAATGHGNDREPVHHILKEHLGQTDLWPWLEKVFASVEQGQATLDFAAALGCEKGVTGYMYHTVPVALHAWLSHPQDLPVVLKSVIACGGDTDTVAAIAGAITAASGAPIPEPWLTGLHEWPASVSWMKKLALQLADVLIQAKPQIPLRVFWPLVMLRNAWFMVVVLLHGFRRLAPPY